jgi:hypothetical protein
MTNSYFIRQKNLFLSGMSTQLSRRSFLKLAGFGLLGILQPGEWVSPYSASRVVGDSMQGRITDEKVDVYDIPSFTGNKVKLVWRDSVFPITTATIGDEEPSYNRVWYQIGEEGFVHSGSMQPVRTLINQPVQQIPVTGALAEVTVPYTDARDVPGRSEDVIYRFYYDTLYWVTEITQDSGGEVWYGVLDDKWKSTHYVLASHIHIIPENELSALSPGIPLKQKRIEVHTNEQVVIAYERDIPVFMSKAATGAAFRDGNHYTPPGRHITFCKRPCRHMAAGDLASNGFDLPGVPLTCPRKQRAGYIDGHNLSYHQRSSRFTKTMEQP